MVIGLRVGAVLAVLAIVGSADAASRRKICRQSCAQVVAQCKATGADRHFCRRDVVRRCQHLGVAYCQAADSTVNGCNRIRAEDHRGESVVRVRFPAGQKSLRDLFDYAPECILVSPGTMVRFEGRLDLQDLVGGTAPTLDPESPIAPTSVGESVEFLLTEPGIFGYYCPTFVKVLMWGAVIVGP